MLKQRIMHFLMSPFDWADLELLIKPTPTQDLPIKLPVELVINPQSNPSTLPPKPSREVV